MGPASAAPFYRAAVARIDAQLQASPGQRTSAQDQAAVNVLWNIGEHVLNDVKDYSTAQSIFRILMRVETKGTEPGRKALWLDSEAIARQQPTDAALTAAARRQRWRNCSTRPSFRCPVKSGSSCDLRWAGPCTHQAGTPTPSRN